MFRLGKPLETKKHLFLFSWLSQSLWLCGPQQTLKNSETDRKILNRRFWKGIPDHLTCLLRNLYAGQEATIRSGHGTTDWFQIGKGVHQAVYCHSAYLTSWEMSDWMYHKLELRLPEEISTISDMQMILL